MKEKSKNIINLKTKMIPKRQNLNYQPQQLPGSVKIQMKN